MIITCPTSRDARKLAIANGDEEYHKARAAYLVALLDHVGVFAVAGSGEIDPIRPQTRPLRSGGGISGTPIGGANTRAWKARERSSVDSWSLAPERRRGRLNSLATGWSVASARPWVTNRRRIARFPCSDLTPSKPIVRSIETSRRLAKTCCASPREEERIVNSGRDASLPPWRLRVEHACSTLHVASVTSRSRSQKYRRRIGSPLLTVTRAHDARAHHISKNCLRVGGVPGEGGQLFPIDCDHRFRAIATRLWRTLTGWLAPVTARIRSLPISKTSLVIC
jgi:hypothetical protein